MSSIFKNLFSEKRKAFSRRMIAIVGGSFFFMLMKTGLVWLLMWLFPTLEAWLNYLIVTTSVTFIGWAYHSTVSFQTGFTKRSLKRYVAQAIVLKALDYGLFNLFVYVLLVLEPLAVILTSGIVFTLRVTTYFKYVFVTDEPTETQIIESTEASR